MKFKFIDLDSSIAHRSRNRSHDLIHRVESTDSFNSKLKDERESSEQSEHIGSLKGISNGELSSRVRVEDCFKANPNLKNKSIISGLFLNDAKWLVLST